MLWTIKFQVNFFYLKSVYTYYITHIKKKKINNLYLIGKPIYYILCYAYNLKYNIDREEFIIILSYLKNSLLYIY